MKQKWAKVPGKYQLHKNPSLYFEEHCTKTFHLLWLASFSLKQTYNHFHNILRLFDVLPNFSFATSETMHDYYLYTWYIRVAERVAERLKEILGN